MNIFRHPSDIRTFLSKQHAGTTTGFVPTMGALHRGHIALIDKARDECRLVISSIFVNPTQFNDLRDFEKYPSTIESDIYMLEKAGCDVLFLPAVDDIYPNGFKPDVYYELGYLETIFEGQYRPGHFQGVCQVVSRLLNIVSPEKLYLGQKDFQQCMVLEKMVRLLDIPTKIVICPTLREPDGLALSSRNLRLNETEREKAPLIYKSLLLIKRNFGLDNTDVLADAAKHLLVDNGFKVDYVAIAEAKTLNAIQNRIEGVPAVALVAAYSNEIRLIDNILL